MRGAPELLDHLHLLQGRLQRLRSCLDRLHRGIPFGVRSDPGVLAGVPRDLGTFAGPFVLLPRVLSELSGPFGIRPGRPRANAALPAGV